MKKPSDKFKKKCPHILSEVATAHFTPFKTKINPAWGSLKGKLVYISPDFDKPLDYKDWTK